MNQVLNKDNIPDYFIAQFPGGGQRGYATVKLLEWFEKVTGLPTHQLFPYVATGSVGILIASALYLPHPDHPNAARMSAKQLAKIFPDIASRMPQPAKFTNNNSRVPFADAIRPFIGHGKLSDLLGTVFFSSHKIGGLAESNVVHGKVVSPQTGKASYVGNEDTKILDIAFAGTSLPALFPAYEDHIDMAFSDMSGVALLKIKNLFPHDAQGAFVRVGNFRSEVEESRKHLKASGYVKQAASFAINGAVSDNTYSQTIAMANEMFQKMVFNLEYEISKSYADPPAIKAITATSAQFAKIETMSEKFITDNIVMLVSLANALKVSALKRMATHPETAFGVPPEIQEFPLYEIPPLQKAHEGTSQSFALVAGNISRGVGSTLVHSLSGVLHGAFDIATSEPVIAVATHLKSKMDRRMSRWADLLLPRRIERREGAQAALPSPITQSHELV